MRPVFRPHRLARRGVQGWRAGGNELVWPGDENFRRSAPILFPVVGWTRNGVFIGGRRYPLGLHGFARVEDFRIVEQAENRALLRGGPSQRTKALYPFEFRLDKYGYLIPRIISLQVVLDVMNEGDGVLTFACGLHPGFNWPLPGARGGHVVRFDAEERAEVPVIAPGGLFSARRRRLFLCGRGSRALSPELFEEALCFLDARSAGLEFAARGGPSLRMELDELSSHRALVPARGAFSLSRSLDRPWRPRKF